MTVSTVSPDVTPLIDLTLLDVTAQDLVEQAIVDAASKLPGWQPREGNTEVVLLEELALMGAETVYAVNRLPRAILAALLAAYGLVRDDGTQAVADFTFTTSSVADLTVPAGTTLTVLYDSDAASLDFTTDTDLLIPGGTFEGTVTATAVERTSILNGTPPGPADLVDAISAVDSVALATEVAGGVDPEDLDGYLARGGTLFRRLVSTLVLPEHFTAAALEAPAVTRAHTYDLFNPDLGTGAPGDHPGHVTVAVTGPGGAALPTQTRTDLEAALEALALASLIVHAVDATVTDVNVTASVTLTPGAVAADVTAAIDTALDDYLNPDAWPFSGTVYRNELIALIDRVPGVGRVVTLTTPATDVALTGTAPLARAGTTTITTV